MGELQGEQNPKGFEYSVFEYQSDSAEELVALLMYQDFDRQEAPAKEEV